MANDTEPLVFMENLDTLLLDCESGLGSAVLCGLSTAVGAASGLVVPLLIAVGLAGNSLTAFVYLCRLRPLTRHGIYLAFIALSDNCNLVTTGLMLLFLALPNAVHFRWLRMRGLTACLFTFSDWQDWTFFAYNLALFYPSLLPFAAILVANGFLVCWMRRVVSEQAQIRTVGSTDTRLANTVICVLLSVLLVVCSLPIVVSSMVNATLILSGTPASPTVTGIILRIGDLGGILILLNQSTSWVVLLWKSVHFRDSCLDTLGCCSGRRRRQDSRSRVSSAGRGTEAGGGVAARSRSVELEMQTYN